MRYQIDRNRVRLSNVFRLAAVLATVLASVLGLAPAQSAHAVSNLEYNRVYWNVTGWTEVSQLAGSRYQDMVNGIRTIAGGDWPAAREGDLIQRTTNTPNRLIEVEVEDRGDLANPHRLSLFFWAHNLYLIGISSEGRNYAFSDVPDSELRSAERIMRNQPWTRNFAQFQPFAFTGRYSGRNGLDPSATRGNLRMDMPTIAGSLRRLGRLASTSNTEQVRNDLTTVIAAASEASRFGWISHRVRQILAVGADYDNNGVPQTTLGGFGMDMENDWSAMTRWVRDSNSNPSWHWVDGVDPYRNPHDMLFRNNDRRMDYFLGLGSVA
ncbi:ribosome-inactivating family protein [Kitasatospora sp. NPDC058048]|uniref:ribosome-inactivating family protein n=1 Tax=Kitasatospora sp. NPDC058048 TaxID=3346313 RepID=UPI0036DAD96E